MNLTDVPARFPIPFANGATSDFIRTIPQAHQTATTSDAPASLVDGFPPETFSPTSAGGVPPNGKDFNGIFNQLSAWSRWQAAGGPAIFNSTFCTAIGGYPKDAQLASTVTPGVIWVSTADGNATDPDSDTAANWVRLARFSDIPDISSLISASGDPGTMKLRLGPALVQVFSGTIASNSQATISFPTPFATECVGVFINGGRAMFSAQDNAPFAQSWDVNSVLVYSALDVSAAITILAIGR